MSLAKTLNPETLFIDNSKVDNEISYEVTKEYKVTVKISFDKEDIIPFLFSEITKLKEKVEHLENEKSPIAENALIKFWDNEYDNQWNEC
ncbi:MAG: hypothetical protein HF976_14410 [ANME-2 cluster archaeon]|nr:hypothetical protein [ANME-2 cluster archaeon]MBC2702566.1 hypothetical protein [ANME-2 cluster archaeon]MBC2708170.1 hypothetical protein [ANME-2 cluster archaeon]MBC2745526.1 hypothetical protein [ANME-2 cluster archaeon]MBC2762696.1 hypothetical protein [ANME-2 cluster archaeon]